MWCFISDGAGCWVIEVHCVYMIDLNETPATLAQVNFPGWPYFVLCHTVSLGESISIWLQWQMTTGWLGVASHKLYATQRYLFINFNLYYFANRKLCNIVYNNFWTLWWTMFTGEPWKRRLFLRTTGKIICPLLIEVMCFLSLNYKGYFIYSKCKSFVIYIYIYIYTHIHYIYVYNCLQQTDFSHSVVCLYFWSFISFFKKFNVINLFSQ